MTLEHDLPGLLDELAANHHVGHAPPLGLHALPLEPARRHHSSAPRVLAVAACTAFVIGGLVFIGGRSKPDTTPANQPDTSPSEVGVPTTMPNATNDATGGVVLAPPPTESVELLSAMEFDRSATAAGALTAPDGTVFSLIVSNGPTWPPSGNDWNAIPAERRDVRTVAGREVAAIIDATSPTQIYRTVRDSCWAVEVVTADEATWSDDVTTLIGALRINDSFTSADGAAVSVDVPPGWTSLGGGRMLTSWVMELTVDIDGHPHNVHLAQVPNAPVGFLLAGESNPRPFDHNGRQWWTVDIVTTPGMTSVIGTTDLGAFHITSDLPTDELVTIVDTLVPTPTAQLASYSGVPGTAVVDTTPVRGQATSCGDLGVGITING
jgi:hypothetical protein